ncbi:MAG: type I methionyl aminopeptidase [Deltaproteobacteria bacterium]|nr:type I methionyl aminopeptidase [Deltaproteobacteria bacterium]
MGVTLKSEQEIASMRKANQVVAQVLRELEQLVAPGVTTEQLDKRAEELTKELGAEAAFLNYPSGSTSVPPFSGHICASVNDAVVHGLPSKRPLVEGDIISIDYGAKVDGFYGDSAITVAVGEVAPQVKKLISVTEQALYAGIEKCVAGNRIGDVSYAIQSLVEKNGFGIVKDFVGHGIGTKMHEDPQVPNYGKPNKGKKLEVGLVIAIEPMVSQGKPAVKLLEDGWTAVLADGTYAAHIEHTVAVTSRGPEILSSRK